VKHDEQCEAGRLNGMASAICNCAERAYERDPFMMDDVPVIKSANA